MIRVDPSPILFYFYFFIRSELVRVDPSRSELIRPGLAVRVDPVRLLYLPLNKGFSVFHAERSMFGHTGPSLLAFLAG